MADMIGLNINVFLRSCVQVRTKRLRSLKLSANPGTDRAAWSRYYQCVGLLVIMALSQWQLTVVTFITVPFVVVVSKLYGEYYKELSKAVQTVQVPYPLPVDLTRRSTCYPYKRRVYLTRTPFPQVHPTRSP